MKIKVSLAKNAYKMLKLTITTLIYRIFLTMNFYPLYKPTEAWLFILILQTRELISSIRFRITQRNFTEFEHVAVDKHCMKSEVFL